MTNLIKVTLLAFVISMTLPVLALAQVMPSAPPGNAKPPTPVEFQQFMNQLQAAQRQGKVPTQPTTMTAPNPAEMQNALQSLMATMPGANVANQTPANQNPAANPANPTTPPPISTMQTPPATLAQTSPTLPPPLTTPPTAFDIPPMPKPAKHTRYRPMSFEENRQTMIDSAPPAPRPTSDQEQLAFSAMMQQNMPLSPQQVVQLRQQIDTSQRAAAITPNIPPKPVSTTLMVNLAPGSTPPAIRLAQGYVTALVFVDSTGSPWPIASFDVGSPRTLNIQWDNKSNIILLQAINPYSTGDMVVQLIGLPTPITLELVAGQRVVDYRVDIHVSGIGPNTKDIPIGTQLPNSANNLLLGVLDGVAPAGSKQLQVRGADAQAWVLGDKMYLRTRLTLLSPGWMGTMVSPDGMHAYELTKTSSVLISRYGEPAELKIEGL